MDPRLEALLQQLGMAEVIRAAQRQVPNFNWIVMHASGNLALHENPPYFGRSAWCTGDRFFPVYHPDWWPEVRKVFARDELTAIARTACWPVSDLLARLAGASVAADDLPDLLRHTAHLDDCWL